VSVRTRIQRLESKAPRSDRSLSSIVQDRHSLRRWLASRGLSAEEALAQGINGPENLCVKVAHLARAHATLRAWRRERFGKNEDLCNY
jgi:hypothetical protein